MQPRETRGRGVNVSTRAADQSTRSSFSSALHAPLNHGRDSL